MFKKTTRLKQIKRQGWIEHDISFDRIESVADHSFGVAFLLLVFSNKFGYSRERAVIGGIIHDLAEALVGDITPRSGISREKKFQLEKKAIEKLDSLTKSKLLDAWLENEKGEGEFQQIFRQIDKMEMLFQALLYETKNESEKLDDFWTVEFQDDFFKKMKELLIKLRKNKEKLLKIKNLI
ncbi:MAG: HD domain-containing protein [Candidatus Helarchaeales archaeon]